MLSVKVKAGIIKFFWEILYFLNFNQFSDCLTGWIRRSNQCWWGRDVCGGNFCQTFFAKLTFAKKNCRGNFCQTFSPRLDLEVATNGIPLSMLHKLLFSKERFLLSQFAWKAKTLNIWQPLMKNGQSVWEGVGEEMARTILFENLSFTKLWLVLNCWD